jgi:hypothetical protein
LLNDGVVFWGNNSFYGSGTFTNNGTLNYNSSSSSLQCRLVNSVPGILNLNGTGPVWLTCTLTNNGTINLLANQSYITANPGDPAVGGTFNISAGASVTFSNDTLSGIINNAGSITTSFSNWFKGTYNSTGTLTVTNGSVYFMSGCSIPSMGFIASKGGVIYFKPGAVPHGIQDTLTILGKIEFSGGSTLTFKDLFIGYYGTLDGSDSVVVTRTFSHQGYLYGTGRKVLSAGCSGTIFNSGWISDTLCNYGALEWKDGDLKNYGRIINYNSLTITAASTGYSYVTIENYGTINRPSGNNAAITFSYPVINFGTINLNGGTNSFNGNSAAVPITGIINSGANVTTNFSNTDLTGTINAAYIIGLSGVANITGTFNNTGTTTNNNGTVTFKSSAVIQNVGTINCAAGSMYFKPGAFIQALSGTLNCIGLVEFSTGKKIALSSVFIDWHGTLQGTDSVTVSTSFSHSGYLRGWGKKILLNSCVGSLSNNAWINDSLYNYGTLNWNDLDIADYGRIFNYGTFNIASTGNSTCYVNIENFGTINRNTTAVSNLTFSYPLLNSGIFNINGGTVFIYANSSNAAAGIINIAAGAKLQLSAAASLGGQISISALGILAGSSYALTFSGHSLFNDGTITTASISFPAITAIGGSGAIATGATVSSGGRVTLSSDHQFKTLTINSGGSFDVGQMMLKLNGSGNPLSITGSFSAQSGTVEFNGTAAQIVIPLNFAAGGVNCNNAAGITLSAPWSHPGTLHLAAGVFNNGTNLTLLNNARIKRSGGTLQT